MLRARGVQWVLPMDPFANPCPSWPAMLLRGSAAVAFGMAVLQRPGGTLVALALILAAWLLADAVLALVAGRRAARRHERWGAFIVAAMVDIAIVVVTLFWPAPTAGVLLLLLGVWGLASGLVMLIGALRFEPQHGRACMAGGGLLSLAAGGLLLLAPGSGGMALTLWMAAFALLSGSVWLLVALRLWREGRVQQPAARAAPRPAW